MIYSDIDDCSMYMSAGQVLTVVQEVLGTKSGTITVCTVVHSSG